MLLLLFLFIAPHSSAISLEDLELNVNEKHISVSGVSAGAFFSVQMHVAFSDVITGAGILAGGPFYCAQDNVLIALGPCMVSPEQINVSQLVSITESTAETGFISSTSNLKNSKIYLFSGTRDTVVKQGSVVKLFEYYEKFVDDVDMNIKRVFSYPAEHAMITDDYGSACDYKGMPYINNCNYSAAFEILNHIYGDVEYASSAKANSSNIAMFNQTKYFVDPHLVSMDNTGFIYIPTNCKQRNSKCKLHIAFHGCRQGYSMLNRTFVEHAGYNQIAEANDIIILYPQVYPTALNPRGCFDWWGYSSPAYASKDGLQMAGVKEMIDDLIRSSDSTSGAEIPF